MNNHSGQLEVLGELRQALWRSVRTASFFKAQINLRKFQWRGQILDTSIICCKTEFAATDFIDVRTFKGKFHQHVFNLRKKVISVSFLEMFKVLWEKFRQGYYKETKIAWLSCIISGADIVPTITSYRKYQRPWILSPSHWKLKRTDYLQNGT